MNSKVQCLRDMLGSACQHRSVSPIRNFHKPVVPATHSHLQQHQLHLQNFLRPKTIEELQKKCGSVMKIDASTRGKFFHVGGGFPAPAVTVGRNLEIEIPVVQTHNLHSERSLVEDKQRNKIQMTNKLQEVKRTFGRRAPISPKDDRYQVSHESEHYNLSARLQHLQPSRMNGFTETNGLKSFEFPINFDI